MLGHRVTQRQFLTKPASLGTAAFPCRCPAPQAALTSVYRGTVPILDTSSLLGRDGHAFGTLSLAFISIICPGLSLCVPVTGEMNVFVPGK